MDDNGSIISSILSSNNDINYYYRTSKDFKFIKNMKVKKLRKHLLSIIDNIKNLNSLPYSYLKEFLEFIYLSYPPNGSYGHIASTKKYSYDETGNSLIGSTVQYPIEMEKNRLDVISDILCDKGTIKVSYRITMNNNPRISFTETKSELVKEKEEMVYSEYSDSYIGTLARNRLIEFLCDDIYNYLMDNIKRSELVQEYSI